MNYDRKIPLVLICLCMYIVCLWSFGNDDLITLFQTAPRDNHQEINPISSSYDVIGYEVIDNPKIKKDKIKSSENEDEVDVTEIYKDLKARISQQKPYKPTYNDSQEGLPALYGHKILNDIPKMKAIKEKGNNSIHYTGVRVINKVEIPLILIWDKPENGIANLQNSLKCDVTTDRSRLADSSAVVVGYSGNKERIYDFPDPKLRKSSQYFVMQLKETPAKYYLGYRRNRLMNGPKIKGVFNGTMYFRRDSDFVHYFGNFETSLLKSYDNGYNNLKTLMALKTDLAAWAVSNCDHTHGAVKRLEFGKMLINNGLNVTTFGDCFNNNNKHEDRFGFSQYKFYLSFENSLHCPDYVTEKFWKNAINAGAVPIVYGPTKEDVKAVAPPHSYIHVDDFATPAKLIKHINYLNENDEAYLEYHKWRLTPAKESIKTLQARYGSPVKVVQPSSEFFELCKKLINKELKPNIIHNMTDWVFGKDKYVDDLCLTPYKPQRHKKI